MYNERKTNWRHIINHVTILWCLHGSQFHTTGTRILVHKNIQTHTFLYMYINSHICMSFQWKRNGYIFLAKN